VLVVAASSGTGARNMSFNSSRSFFCSFISPCSVKYFGYITLNTCSLWSVDWEGSWRNWTWFIWRFVPSL